QTSGITDAVSDLLYAASPNKYVFLLWINIVLLVAGCFIEATSALYIFVPIMLPVAIRFGYDPIALCIIMTMNLAIGLVTPPVGVNLFVACGVAKISIKEICSRLAPFLIAGLICLALITYFPQISMFLPNLLSGGK
ncbi:MAG: TRAP transporter large permease subunit, partial [Candidatus Adiutrix sp.]